MIRVLLVEPTGLWRRALAAHLSNEDDMDVVAELEGLYGAAAMAAAVRPDVAVIDIGPLATDETFAGGAGISSMFPGCSLVMLADPGVSGVVLRLGSYVRGLFAKDGSPKMLAECIRLVVKGERIIDPALAVAALSAPANPLTPREREILRVAALGVPCHEIATRLHLSVGTVRNYLSMIIRKTGGRNRMEAVRLAEDAGWI